MNYAAKMHGVKRGDNFKIAKEKCPNILLVHVEVLGALTASSTDETSASSITFSLSQPDRSRHKASLRRYREASDEVYPNVVTNVVILLVLTGDGHHQKSTSFIS